MSEKVILIVDDDPVFIRLTESTLTEDGMKVITAFNKAEGLSLFERHHPDAVILDIFLPDGSGVDLIKPVRISDPKVPIIMVSGQSEVEEVVRAMKEGANDYIKKPFRGEELLLKIQLVLEATQTKWELDALKTQSRAEEEYKLLFSLSDRMSKVQAIVDQVANTDITVLITGESGTGKELVVKALHKSSERAGEPFIKVNCAALPRELLESELFGFEKGAFTGAHRRKYGRFEMAQNGSIFLDEISEMDLDLQSKLLHVLQEKQFYRIGGEREVKVNCRILTATNKKLEDMVDDGRFRRDLFYRINVVNIVVPPLRERKEDIPLLADYFLKRYEEMYNRDSVKISGRLMEMFLEYSWPGNIRELENNIKRLIILGNEAQLLSELVRKRKDGPTSLLPGKEEELGHVTNSPSVPLVPTSRKGNGEEEMVLPDKYTLKEVAKIAQRNAERELIGNVLKQTRWNRRKAAQILDISYKALLYKIKECGLDQV
jgi:two-component system response regulator AtoC